MIHDIRADVNDGRSEDRKEPPRLVVVHRIWFDFWPLDKEVNAIEIYQEFLFNEEVAKVTGGELPYSVLVDRNGECWQGLSVNDVGKHAKRWNTPAIGVGVIGDFRQQSPTRAQYTALADFLAELLPSIGRMPHEWVLERGQNVQALSGHDELPDGSSDPNKKCPGRFLPMAQLRDDVARIIQAQAGQRLSALGLAS